MKKALFPIFIFCFFAGFSQTPESTVSDSTSNHRKLLVGIGSGTAYVSSMVVLNKAWYADYPRSRFHTFNDGGEWLQMDKIGHAWTAYNSSRLGYSMWKWAGMKENSSVVLGTASSLAFMLTIEYFDGRSAEWGWSWPDVAADLSGAALFSAQQLALHKQIFNIKWSGHINEYRTPELENRADKLFGKSAPERLLKDYNSQTYWLSFPAQKLINGLPEWLNISLGYGAQNMFGGYQNVGKNEDGSIYFDRRDLTRYRQWYIAPDVDLTKLKIKSPFLRSCFSVLNSIKFPAPAISFSKKGFSFQPIAF